jgi:hypothetical protein
MIENRHDECKLDSHKPTVRTIAGIDNNSNNKTC